jgi:predicted outer membrane protein
MNSLKNFTRRPYFLVLSCLCIFLLFSWLKLGVFKASTSKMQANFPVKSLVPGLAIADVKIEKDNVILTLRNDSNKTITAFSWSSSEVIYRSEMVGSENTIAPGATKEKTCSLPSPASSEKGITILAVVYEDGTSDGVAKFVKQILDERAGTQAQLSRILPLFRDALATPQGKSLMKKRESIKLKLEQLPEDEDGQSLEFRIGLHNEKERALESLKQMGQVEQEQGEDVARHALPSIVNRYEKRNLAILNSLKQAR